MRIGIMQGRLVPPGEGRFQCFPRDNWAEEFPLAARAGLNAIEWIYDVYGADMNPIANDAGIERMKALSELHGIQVRSVCADYFMDRPLLRGNIEQLEERVATLRWLMLRCQALQIARIVLPFVDASAIENQNDLKDVVSALLAALPVAEETGIELHLETSLPPAAFAALLGHVSHPIVRVNYDSGNSASLGYNPQEEFRAYGERIGSVHIKDRRRGGGTVPLGTGNTNFSELRDCLKACAYTGDFILQVARGESGDEVEWTRRNRAFVEAWWKG